MISKQDKVFNYLISGKTLSQDSAFAMFNVGNLRATISDIKPFFRSNGFVLTKSVGRNGETRYGLMSKKKSGNNR